LALLLFGWDRIKPTTHFFATLMVALGALFSAVWIVVANSWQQTPAGYHIVGEGMRARAEITNFWAMVFSPSSMDRLSHVVMGAWQAGAFLVLSVSAYYLLKKRHLEFAKASMKIGVVLAVISSLGQLVTGHTSARGVARYQPTKLAAMEAHFEMAAPADLHLFGWVDQKKERVSFSVAIPGFLSFLATGDRSQPLVGLRFFNADDLPPVNFVFQAFHAMVIIGLALIALSFLGVFYWWRGTLFEKKWLLRLFVVSVLGPQAANQLGWLVAEVGRQPWVVYGLLRTSEGLSKAVRANDVLTSLILFTLIYSLLFVLFIYLLDRKIKTGPEPLPKPPAEHPADIVNVLRGPRAEA
jgi:cytochrome d ubiquinol oxidase subunit I